MTEKTRSLKKEKNVWIDSVTPKKFFKEIMKNKEAQRAYHEEKWIYDFFESIEKEMKRKRLTNKALAKKAGLNYQIVVNIFNQPHNIQIKTLFSIAHALGKILIVKLYLRFCAHVREPVFLKRCNNVYYR
jgi:DNA-binding XRE family transcriptional regulator